MAKKKRAVKKAPVASNQKNTTPETHTEETLVTEALTREKPKKAKPVAASTTIVTRRHKKFGKFHCLVEETQQAVPDESNLSENVHNVPAVDESCVTTNKNVAQPKQIDNEVSERESSCLQSELFDNPYDTTVEAPVQQTEIIKILSEEKNEISIADEHVSNEKENTISSNIEEMEVQSVEDILEKMNTSDTENSEINETAVQSGYVEIIEYQPSEMSPPEECEETEIAQKFSNLDVSIVQIDENEEILIDSTQDTNSSENIFHVDSFEDDVNVVECIAEEIIEPTEESGTNITEENNQHIDDNLSDNISTLVPKADSIKCDPKTIKNSKNQENVSESNDSSCNTPESTPINEPADNKTRKSKSTKKTKVKNSQARNKTKTKQEKKKKSTSTQNSDSNGSSTTSESSVRRSNRIKSISVLKKRSKGHGLVKSTIINKAQDSDTSENSNSGPIESEKPISDFSNFVMPSSNISLDQKPVKVKSRWRRSSELEMGTLSPSANNRGSPQTIQATQENVNPVQEPTQNAVDNTNEVETRLKQFVHLKENNYLTERFSCKEAKKMICDCFLTPEEIERGEYGCGEDCLNRLLMIECGGLCPVGERCTNKRFQKSQFAPCEVFKTEKKGLGIRAKANIPYGEFILEYVGEVLDPEEFENRASDYSKDNNRHYYFMSLRADAIIDATVKGNISRFINHSCDPNAETQKWTVNGELRIGFFSKRTILAGEEITFDYQFQRYGKEAQKCFCESSLCRGWLGEEPDDDEDDDEDDEEYEELEEDKDETVENKLEEQEKTEGESVTEDGVKEKSEISKKVPVKRKRNKMVKAKTRKEIFDDLDQLDREIDSLFTTGLKNQAQTLKLSRLMVRAKEPSQRSKLLKLLRNGEFPCRRLFLDYHGLRLIHGWMTDAQHMSATDKKLESLRLEILQTLATLPIPNKTMLQDSKVLPTVEKWSVPVKENVVDSDSNSPKPELYKEQEDTDKDQVDTKELIDNTNNIGDKANEDVKTNVENITTNNENVEIKSEITENAPSTEETEKMSIEETIFGKDENPPEPQIEITDIKNEEAEIVQELQDKKQSDETTDLQREDMDISPVNLQEKEAKISKPPAPEVKEEFNYEEEIIALAIKLLEEWSVLKEVFRIPKKERIEQMKEHEREADRKYKAGLGLDLEHMGIKKSENRYRILQRYRAIEKIDNTERNRKHSKLEDRNIIALPKISKHERRKLFAMQVEHAEEERRRKQREMWRQHEQHCFVMGTDPRFTAPYDASQGYHCIWNPQTGQWQNYPLPQPYNPNVPQTYSYGNSVTNISPNLVHFPNHQMQMPSVNNPNCMPQIGSNVGHVLNTSSKTHMSYQETAKVDPTQVKFMGPIPPPVKLPPKWKCAKDKYGRPYYYHIKIRKAQWEPPVFTPPEEESETSSSSDTSSLSSDTSSDDTDSDDDMDDARLLQEIRTKFKQMEDVSVPVPEKKVTSKRKMNINDFIKESENESNEEEEDENETTEKPSIDMRLKDLLKKDEKGEPLVKKRRSGLVEEIIISPRTEEDRLQYKEDVKRYKENKAKLKKQKEIILQQTKKQLKAKTLAQKKHKATIKSKLKEITIDKNSEAAKKIKETFRSSMAGVMVGILNAYRKPECKEGRITNTEDFKHLARKLTHFVMLKELKHCANIEDLTCTDSVKSKAKEFVRKYMSKFGEVYQKPKDDLEYY